MMILFSLLLLAFSCAPNSLQDFQHEGEAWCRSLAEDLRKVRTRDELIQAVPKIKKKFDQLVDLMIAAKEYQQNHLDEEELQSPEPIKFPFSETLLWELKRIYAMEGGRETMEKAEKEALIRLDAYEKNRIKHIYRK